MTNQNINPSQSPNGWESSALFTKAQLYIEEMRTIPRDDWRFLLWSTLSLELLSRATLANINPALLAEHKDWNNLLYSLGIQPRAKKFIPKSIDITAVFTRLQELLPDFTPELEGFCTGHMAKRNEELHSGHTPFVEVNSSSWLPGYYRSCSVLLLSMGSSLELYLGTEEAQVATAMIDAATDESAKVVAKSINAHNLVWSDKDSSEKSKLKLQATNWATRFDGHRVICPSCNCNAVVTGSGISAPIKTIEGDEITETQQYLPSKFECIACGLKISGLSQISAAGLGDAYKATFTYDAAEYYAPEDEYSEYEPDFNEP